MAHPNKRHPSPRAQRGAALLVSIVLFALIGVSIVLTLARGSNSDPERDRQTEEALAQAKAALIGYAMDVVLNDYRLGELPCPDTDDDGTTIVQATGLPEVCTAQDKRLGRLPWRTLGLPDLRDRDGERLWYAVSVNFKRDNLSHCVPPTAADCINSDSRGTITVRDATGAIVHDGTNPDPWTPSGVIAVIIAPGNSLTRQGAGSGQDRSGAGRNVAANYLDNVAAGEDNAAFIDGSQDGFISGPVRTGGNTVVNDRIAVITYQDLIPQLEKRVAREVANCLDSYASANGGRYPWAADTIATATIAALANGPFPDVSGLRAGRIPDALTATANDSAGPSPMSASWSTTRCSLGLGLAWWQNWKLHVFYSLADAYKPDSTGSTPNCLSSSCLWIVTPTGNVLGARYFVAIGGRRLAGTNGGQPRSGLGDLANPANYLEGENVFGASTLDKFVIGSPTASFNDVAFYK